MNTIAKNRFSLRSGAWAIALLIGLNACTTQEPPFKPDLNRPNPARMSAEDRSFFVLTNDNRLNKKSVANPMGNLSDTPITGLMGDEKIIAARLPISACSLLRFAVSPWV